MRSAPTLIETTAIRDVKRRELLVRFQVNGGYVWEDVSPGTGPPGSLDQYADECSTCKMITLGTGVPALLMGQPGAPNSIVWDDRAGNEWNFIGSAHILPWDDATRYANDVSSQQQLGQ